METKRFNGHDLELVKGPLVFEKPKEMLAWNVDNPTRRMIVAVLHNGTAIDVDKNWIKHCAEIPDDPKPRRATNRELAKWLAQGNGEWGISNFGVIRKAEIHWFYDTGYEKETLQSELRVRKWDDIEWHEPTIDYMGIEQ